MSQLQCSSSQTNKLIERGVGITDIPDSRTRGPAGVGMGAGKTNTGMPDSITRGPVAPAVLVISSSPALKRQMSVCCHLLSVICF